MKLAIPFPDIDPILFSFDAFGRTFAIHWYAVAYIVGILLAWRIAVFLARRPVLWKDNTPPIPADRFEDVLTAMILGIIIGGRLGYVVFYKPMHFMANPLEIVRVWEGGMSFHGGFIGVIVAGVIWAWRNQVNPWSLGDVLAIGAPIGLMLGRLANFINAELWGRPTDQPWGVVFPNADCPIWWLSDTCARHPSQLYEAFLEGAVLFSVAFYLALRKGWLKTPGALIGVFFAGYGLARTFVEGFRQGDDHYVTPSNPWGHVIHFGNDATAWGLTMGQLLSLPMIAIGIFLIWRARWR